MEILFNAYIVSLDVLEVGLADPQILVKFVVEFLNLDIFLQSSFNIFLCLVLKFIGPSVFIKFLFNQLINVSEFFMFHFYQLSLFVDFLHHSSFLNFFHFYLKFCPFNFLFLYLLSIVDFQNLFFDFFVYGIDGVVFFLQQMQGIVNFFLFLFQISDQGLASMKFVPYLQDRVLKIFLFVFFFFYFIPQTQFLFFQFLFFSFDGLFFVQQFFLGAFLLHDFGQKLFAVVYQILILDLQIFYFQSF